LQAGVIDGGGDDWRCRRRAARRSVLEQYFVVFKSIIEFAASFAGSLARRRVGWQEMTVVDGAERRRRRRGARPSVTNADCHLADYSSSSSM